MKDRKEIEGAVVEMQKLVIHANRHFKPVGKHLARAEKGCVIVMRYGSRPYFVQKMHVIGTPDKTRMPAFFNFAEEKIFRAAQNEHATSLQSADAAKKQYAGGIVCRPWSVGISGLDQYDDHCFALALLVQTGKLQRDIAERYAGSYAPRLNAFLTALPVM